jgi:hypothetical protein
MEVPGPIDPAIMLTTVRNLSSRTSRHRDRDGSPFIRNEGPSRSGRTDWGQVTQDIYVAFWAKLTLSDWGQPALTWIKPSNWPPSLGEV